MRNTLRMSRKSSHTATIEPAFLRARDVARRLAVSESQVRNWQHAGVLRAVRLPGIRAVRFTSADVERVASECSSRQ